MVRAGEVDADRVPAGSGVQERGDGTQCLREHRIRPAVQNSQRLAISGNRHGAHDDSRFASDYLYAHLPGELFSRV
nr:hypothetical protein StreXyl84_75580 [Streptomyces sp. Xyl84]